MQLPHIPEGATIIDSHAHVVREYFQDDQDEVIRRAFDSGITQIVNPGVVTDNLQELFDICDRYDHIYTAPGLHPHEARHWNETTYQTLKEAACNPKAVGIGECGLDFFYNLSDHESQVNVLTEQIRLALEVDKPIIIHCRDAWTEVLDLLQSEGQGKLRGVFHCFTGGPEILGKIEELDFYVSFSGIVTFPNAKPIQEAAKRVKTDRILVETDCPYLAPQKVRGKRNEPAYVWWTVDKLCELRQTDLPTMARQCSQNARALFRLP